MGNQIVGKMPGEDILGTMANLMQKLRHGEIMPEEFKRFVKRENPFMFMDSVWSVASAGYSGEELVSRMMAANFEVDDIAAEMMRQSEFKTTSGICYHLVGIRAESFSPSSRTFSNILQEATGRRGYRSPPPEAAALLRFQIGKAELGSDRILVCHDPIHRRGYPCCLVLADPHPEHTAGALTACDVPPDAKWMSRATFVFEVPCWGLHRAFRCVE